MKVYFWITITSLSLLTTVFSQEAKRLVVLSETTADKLLEIEGDTVRVKGFVESTNKNATGIEFLKFKEVDFQCVTFARYVRYFEAPPIELYKEKWIEVTGVIENYRGRPQIKLTKPDQVVVLEMPAPVSKVIEEPEQVQVQKLEKKEVLTQVETVVKETNQKDLPLLEVIDGVPAIEWRKYFPDNKKR